MADGSRISQHFEELARQYDLVLATKSSQLATTFAEGGDIDADALTNWKVRATNLLSIACGESSIHYKHFNRDIGRTSFSTYFGTAKTLKAIFDAAREDFESGFCKSYRSLIQAEVFDRELDQASELANAGYHTAAAVIARVVLETTLRELCDKHSLPHGKLDKMNADLAKTGQYNVLKQKQITALADVGNNAAHGHTDKYTPDDVIDMIQKVELFVADQI